MFVKPHLILITLMICLVSFEASLLARPKVQPTDFTKGGKPPANVKWALGPTGMRGWTYHKHVEQIYIWDVAKGSPADGKIQGGDVILGIISPLTHGISKGQFNSDPRKQLAAAITEAEKRKNAGRLTLNIWSKGKKKSVPLKIKVMGTYSETAPVNCPKTDLIIEMLCQSIAKKTDRSKNIAKSMDMLGLLATGDKKYLPIIRAYAQHVSQKSISEKPRLPTWPWGYSNLFLAEYYLATGDKAVLPGIKHMTEKLVTGQSLAGTWGHGTVKGIKNEETGRIVYALGGYGAINQVGIVCAISLALAKKCDIKQPGLDQAIQRSADFFGYYAERGTIPYGDGPPKLSHDSNGKSSSAAVFFNLIGDRRSAEFFSRMTLASYNEREGGHTGNYWSFLWGGLGAGMSGNDSLTQFLKDLRWYHELERRWDGDLQYQGILFGEKNRTNGNSARGARLLQLCAPRRKLHITGKGGLVASELKSQALLEAARPSRQLRENLYDSQLTPKILLEDLGSWSPPAREQAAMKIGKMANFNAVKPLIQMLKSQDRHLRYGACQGLRYAGRANPEAARLLVELGIKSDDPVMQYFAVIAFSEDPKRRWPLGGMHKALSGAMPELLKLAINLDTDDSLMMQVANVIAGDKGKHLNSLKGKDRKLLVDATLNLMKSRSGKARSTFARAAFPRLTKAELDPIWGEIFIASVEKAPSGAMFTQHTSMEGIKVMAKHGVKEGIKFGGEFTVSYQGWGGFIRFPGGIRAMSGYGSAAKDFIPLMRKKASSIKRGKSNYMKILDKMEKTSPPSLFSIQPKIDEALNK